MNTRASCVVPLLVLAAGLVACGSTDGALELAEGAQPIVNGQLDSGDPAVVYIDVGCSGTLVSPRVVLTACHCVNGASSPSVYFGSNIGEPGTWIDSIHHQVYNPSQCIGDGDIAMITLAEAGPATPIPINDRPLATHVGQDVRLVGFGVVGGNSGGNGVKRQGVTKLHDLEPGVMWVGGQTSGFCYGDSGGPNFMIFEGQEHVAGVTSFTSANCTGVGNDGSARTDTYYAWITGYIDAHDPATCNPDGRCAGGCAAVDLDCPCAGDGFCTDACGDLGSDPDCSGCGSGDSCRADCPVLDSDCCAADGQCTSACGDLDPDCVAPEDPPAAPGPGDAVNAGDEPDEDGSGIVGSVTCGVGRSAGHEGWLLVAVGVLLGRSRRRRR